MILLLVNVELGSDKCGIGEGGEPTGLLQVEPGDAVQCPHLRFATCVTNCIQILPASVGLLVVQGGAKLVSVSKPHFDFETLFQRTGSSISIKP